MQPHRTTTDGTTRVIDHPARAAREAELVVEGLRRRRDATWRLEPLTDGSRDPIDRLTIRSSSMPATVVWAEVHPDPAQDLAVLRTTDRIELRIFLTDMGWPARWSPAGRGYLIYASDLPDLEAAAQYRGNWIVRRKRVSDAA